MEQYKALFLDRDGIVNVDHGYVCKIEDFEFTKGIFDLVKLFLDAEYLIFIVTNQSGIGRGYYSEDDLTVLSDWIMKEFRKKKLKIEKIYHCPHRPEEKCLCRKPETGMIDEILETYAIDLAHSWMIGDKQSDIDLAHNAHIGSSIAIGDRQFHDYDYSFTSIKACSEYLEENKGKIL